MTFGVQVLDFRRQFVQAHQIWNESTQTAVWLLSHSSVRVGVVRLFSFRVSFGLRDGAVVG